MPSTTTIGILLGLAATLAAVFFFALRWIALRIARRAAITTERAISVAAEQGLTRTGGISSLRALDDVKRQRAIAQIDRVAHLMDRAVPLPVIGGIGLDPLLGLVPVVGDAFSLGASSVIILRAAQLGVPEADLSRMIAIKCTDLVLGAVPVLGDLIDVAYQGNIRCLAIVQEHLAKSQPGAQPAAAGQGISASR